MSDFDTAKKAFAMSAGLPATSSGQHTSPKRVSDIIDLTLSDEEILKSDDGSEDDSDNGSEMIMLDGPSTAAPAYNAPLTMDYQPDPILPCDVNWPFILKMSRNTPKCLIPRQFITPSLFGRRLDLLNPHHRFTTPQYKAAWVYTVNQCRDKVDLTATFACNPGLDQHSFLKLIDDVFEQITINDYGVDFDTRAEELATIRSELPHATGKELKKLLREEKSLNRVTIPLVVTPSYFDSDVDALQPTVKTRLTKNERSCLKAAAESQARILGRDTQIRHISSAVYERREKRHDRKKVAVQSDGSWGTAANTLPLSRNRMLQSDTREHHVSIPESSILSRAMADQASATAPALVPSSWYSPSEPQVFNTGFSNNADFAPFKPYTPTRFSREDILCSHPMSESTPSNHDFYRPQSDSYRPHPDSHRPEPRHETYRPQYNTNSGSLPRRPRSPQSLSHRPDRRQRKEPSRQSQYTQPITYASSPSSLTLTPTPASLPPRPRPRHTQTLTPSPATTYYSSPNSDFPSQTMGMGVALRDGGVRLGSGVRSRWEEERDGVNVIVKLVDDGDVDMEGDGVGNMGGNRYGGGNGSGYEMLPEGRDEHEKYYVQTPMLESRDEHEGYHS